MSSWKEYKLGDIVSSNNKSIDKTYEFKNIQYLDTGSLTNNKIDGFQEFKISDAPSRAKRLVKYQDSQYLMVLEMDKLKLKLQQLHLKFLLFHLMIKNNI